MQYTFDLCSVHAVLSDTRRARNHAVPYTGPSWGCPLQTDAGVLLVGDQGVYLMTNATPMPSNRTIAYAREADPTTLPFEAWWNAKRNGFGGDDGVEFFSLVSVEEWVSRWDASSYDIAVLSISDAFLSLLAPPNVIGSRPPHSKEA